MSHNRPLLLRPLLPQPSQSSPPGNPVVNPQPADSRRKAKEKAVVAACDPCRKRKTKCDAKRPICSPCASRARECQYSTNPAETRPTAAKRKYGELEQTLLDLRRSESNLERLLGAIRSRDPDDATSITRRIQQGEDIDSLLRSLSTADVLLQLHVKPETRYRFQCPDRIDMPIYLRRADNPYLNALLYDAAFAPPESTSRERERREQ
ncbi:hypothetical protein F5Y14DRAFT_426851 [Nemania sp. NC0429]|nr:hypothetical protein F5Y14DRAFT_426851 [Nemania sp. NC0429]